MKFIHYLEKISGVSIYGLSSLIIFGLFFLVMTLWALKADKKMIEELRNLPLDKLKSAGKAPLLLLLLLSPALGVHAAGPPQPSVTDNPFVVIMIIIIVLLGIVVALLGNVLTGAAQIPAKQADRQGQQGDEQQEEGPTYASGLARTGNARAVIKNFSPLILVPGLSDTAFYSVAAVIVLELLIILTLLYNVKLVLSIHKKEKRRRAEQEQSQPAAPRLSWWEKANSFRPAHEEVELDLGHDYDGIRELDNKLPPWWLYGFYCTILFAGVYLWRYHIGHTAPLSGEEYTISVQKAEQQKLAFLKNAANLVDENTVKRLTDAGELAAGQKVFEATCFACHGKAGEGGVGPNLTDEYWLHGGSVQDIFKSVKYGWPDKGMKSWKDDFSPAQIAQIASYVMSLQGTHPANAKPPQGTVSK